MRGGGMWDFILRFLAMAKWVNALWPVGLTKTCPLYYWFLMFYSFCSFVWCVLENHTFSGAKLQKKSLFFGSFTRFPSWFCCLSPWNVPCGCAENAFPHLLYAFSGAGWFSYGRTYVDRCHFRMAVGLECRKVFWIFIAFRKYSLILPQMSKG